MARLLSEHFSGLEKLVQATEEDLEKLDEVGPVVTKSVAAFFSENQNRETIEVMQSAGLELRNPFAGAEGGPLSDLTFVFTGKLERWSRDEIKRMVEQMGGHAVSSVSGETDYVVAGPGAGSKLEEAKKREVNIMDEEEFADFIEKKRS